jgi:hypothetical protein
MKEASTAMKIVKATRKYEAWLASHLTIVPSDLEVKHQIMADDIFTFMRATLYRWMQLWFEKDDFKSLRKAPTVFSAGDVHPDNISAWRDVEGRLVWGIDDFDEAYPLAYTSDLVRLVTSAYLALDNGFDVIPTESIAGDIIAGYQSGLGQGGGAIVLAEESVWLRDLISEELQDPEQFWEKLTDLPTRTEPLPPAAQQAIESVLPPGIKYRVSDRDAGSGGRGIQRFVAWMNLNGAKAAREAKQLTVSAASLQWLNNTDNGADTIYFNQTLDGAIRSQDPFLREVNRWRIRRLSPDAVRIDLSSLDSEKLVSQVLNAMGWEVANVHLGSPPKAIKKVLKDLDDRGAEWLPSAANEMLEFLQDDFRTWRTDWLEQQGS